MARSVEFNYSVKRREKKEANKANKASEKFTPINQAIPNHPVNNEPEQIEPSGNSTPRANTFNSTTPATDPQMDVESVSADMTKSAEEHPQMNIYVTLGLLVADTVASTGFSNVATILWLIPLSSS